MKLKHKVTGQIWSFDATNVSNSLDGQELNICIKDNEGRRWIKTLGEIMENFTVYKGV